VTTDFEIDPAMEVYLKYGRDILNPDTNFFQSGNLYII